MNPTLLVCKAFLDSSPLQKELMGHLPLQDKEKLSHYEAPSLDIFMEDVKEAPLEKIHVSWIAPILRNFSEKEMSLFFSILSDEQVCLLEKQMLISRVPVNLSTLADKFFRSFLFARVLDNEKLLLPLKLLPEVPLTPLLSLSFTEMENLIRFLALYDLAGEMKIIIDNKKIKALQDCLSQNEKDFLRSLMQQRNILNFGKMEIGKWDMDPQSLHKMLFQRGINRLAKACFGSDRSFIWYIIHMLDISLSKPFEKLCTQIQDNEAQEILTAQIKEILTYMKKRS